jgi:hypothetical protein
MSGNPQFLRMAAGLAEAKGKMHVVALPKPFAVAEVEAAFGTTTPKSRPKRG